MLHDRNPLFVKLSDGGIAQRLHRQDSQQAPPAARVQARREPASAERPLSIVGMDKQADPRHHRTGRRAPVGASLCARSTRARFRRCPPHPPSSPSWSAGSTARPALSTERSSRDPSDDRAHLLPPTASPARHVLWALIGFFGVIFAVNGDLRLCRRGDLQRRRYIRSLPQGPGLQCHAQGGGTAGRARLADRDRLRRQDGPARAELRRQRAARADHGARHQCHAQPAGDRQGRPAVAMVETAPGVYAAHRQPRSRALGAFASASRKAGADATGRPIGSSGACSSPKRHDRAHRRGPPHANGKGRKPSRGAGHADARRREHALRRLPALSRAGCAQGARRADGARLLGGQAGHHRLRSRPRRRRRPHRRAASGRLRGGGDRSRQAEPRRCAAKLSAAPRRAWRALPP